MHTPGSETGGDTLTKVAQAMECNLHWDNLSYWTFFPHSSFHRLHSDTPERLVAAYLGSPEAFSELWAEGSSDGAVRPADNGGPPDTSGVCPPPTHGLLPSWAPPHVADTSGGVASCSREGGTIPLRGGCVTLQLDLKRVRGVAALGLMGHWLSREAVPPVIPPLEQYIEGVARNENLPSE